MNLVQHSEARSRRQPVAAASGPVSVGSDKPDRVRTALIVAAALACTMVALLATSRLMLA
jgi:hypothetical protein